MLGAPANAGPLCKWMQIFNADREMAQKLFALKRQQLI